MFKWIIDKFKKPKVVPVPKKKKAFLTKRERLMAVLVSYRYGKITLEQAVDFIYVWKLLRDI